MLLTLTAAPAVHAENALRTMIATDIRGLMPGISPDDNTGLVLQHVYEGLVAWRTDGTVAPMLAKEIATSADGRTYTFTLRDGVTFHNGAPLTSAEVVWSWQRFLDPKSGWPCRANFDGTRQIKVVAVEASTPTQIMFRLPSRAARSSACWRAATATAPASRIPIWSVRTEPGNRHRHRPVQARRLAARPVCRTDPPRRLCRRAANQPTV